jgi:hypothetical protein
MEDREIGEHRLVSRQIRRAIAADGEPGGKDTPGIHANVWSRQNFVHARHDVTMVLTRFSWTLPDDPNS